MLLAGGAKYHKTVALSSIWTPSFLQSSENIQSSTLLQVCLTPKLLWKMYSRLFRSYQTTLFCLHATNRPYYGASYHFIVSCEIWHGDFKKVIKPTTIKLRRSLLISNEHCKEKFSDRFTSISVRRFEIYRTIIQKQMWCKNIAVVSSLLLNMLGRSICWIYYGFKSLLRVLLLQ